MADQPEKPEIKVTARVLDARPEGVKPPTPSPAEESAPGVETAGPPLPEGPIRWPSYLVLAMLAWLSLFVHIGAAVCSVVWVLPGWMSAGAERTRYLAGAGLGWGISWALWMICSVVVVAFMAVLSRMQPIRNAVTYLASLLAGIGCAVELICDLIFMLLLPAMTGPDGGASRPGREGRAGPEGRPEGRPGGARAAAPLFQAFEKLAFSASMIITHALFALAVWLMTRQMAKNGVGSGATTVIGFLTLVGAAVLVYAGFALDANLSLYATGPVVLLYVSWTLSVARDMATAQGALMAAGRTL